MIVASTIDPNKTIKSITDRLNEEQVKNDPEYIEIKSQVAKIIALADRYDVPRGDALILIDRIFGLNWNTIPYGKFQEIEMFFSTNWFRVCQVTSPKIHEQLMSTENEYSRWFKTQENIYDGMSNGTF